MYTATPPAAGLHVSVTVPPSFAATTGAPGIPGPSVHETASRSTGDGGEGVNVRPARNWGRRQSHTRTGSTSMFVGRPFHATVAAFNAPCACIAMLKVASIVTSAADTSRLGPCAASIHETTGIRNTVRYGRTSAKNLGPYEGPPHQREFAFAGPIHLPATLAPSERESALNRCCTPIATKPTIDATKMGEKTNTPRFGLTSNPARASKKNGLRR